MSRQQAQSSRSRSRRRWPRYLVAVAGLCLAMLAPEPYAHSAAPPVPAELKVPAGHRLFLAASATGTQNYVCLRTDAGFGWEAVVAVVKTRERHKRRGVEGRRHTLQVDQSLLRLP